MRNLTPNFVFMYGLLNDISSLREQDYKMITSLSKNLRWRERSTHNKVKQMIGVECLFISTCINSVYDLAP